MKSLKRIACPVGCLVAIATLLQCGGSSHNIPPLIITPAALPNGTAGTQYSQAIQAAGGVAPYTWTSSGVLPHNLQLRPGTGNTEIISGTPDTPVQADTFSVKVTDSASQSASQPYIVSILGLPDTLTLSPASLTFNPQLSGTTSAMQTATLDNSGSSSVAINDIAPTGGNSADFTQSNTCGSSLAPGANCVITVTFTPSLAGPRVASITINDDTAGTPHQLGLNGTGLSSGPNATLSASSLIFSGQAVGTTSPAQTLTLTNYGTATLNIAGIDAATNFAETHTCGATLASAASCPISVSFAPSVLGNLTGALSVTGNETGSPQTVALSGTGTTSQGTLTGECFGTRDTGGCGQVSSPVSCPVGTVAINPQVVSGGCPGKGGPITLDLARGCQGTERHIGHVVGSCTVN